LPVNGAVRVEEVLRGGQTAYAISNAHLQAIVRPADGGSVSFLPAPGTAPPAEAAIVLASDSLDSEPCAYQLDYETASDPIAALTFGWTSRSGVRIQKTVSVLEGQQIVRLSYRIENGSHLGARLRLGFQCGSSPEEPWRLRAWHRSGLTDLETSSLPRDGAVLDYVRWFSATGSAGQGAAVIAGSGLLRHLYLPGSSEAHAPSLQGEAMLVPAGRVLRTQLALAPFAGEEPITAATEQLLCSASVERADSAVQVNLRAFPLTHLNAGSVALRFTRPAGGTAPEIRIASAELRCGRPQSFSFRWQPTHDGAYHLDLAVSGVKAPVRLGECRVAGDQLEFVPFVALPIEKTALGTVPDWSAPSPIAEAPVSPPSFFGSQGQIIDRLNLDVGVCEREASVLGLAFGSFGAAEVRLTELVAARSQKTLPLSAVQPFHVMSPVGRVPEDVSGFVVRAEGPPWRFGSLLGLRLDIPEVSPATYQGQIELTQGARSASLALGIRVWPVRRPRPGLVELQLNDLSCNLFADDVRPLCEALQQRAIANVTVDPQTVLKARTVSVRLKDATEVGLQEWLPGQSYFAQRKVLPPLDFSAANDRLEQLLMSGLSSITLHGELTIDAISHAAVPADQRAAFAQWFWGEFSEHLRSRGFRSLQFMEERPLGLDRFSEEWSAAAYVLRRAGWSVCGPYDRGVLDAGFAARVGGLSRVVVLSRAAAANMSAVRARLPAATRIGVWAAGLPAAFSSARARYYVRQLAAGGPDLIVFGSVGHAAEVDSDRERAMAESAPGGDPRFLRSLMWEGVRDALDEVNYVQALEWYEQRFCRPRKFGPVPGPKANLAKRQAFERLSEFRDVDRRSNVSLYWNDLTLVERGKARAAIAIDRRFAEQRSQAAMLNQIAEDLCGVGLPVMGLSRLEKVPDLPLAFVFGTPETNALVGQRWDEDADLAWRLQRGGYMFVEFMHGQTACLAMVSADAAEWGRPLIAFKMGLRQEGNWLVP
jgi:hypothetical protein